MFEFAKKVLSCILLVIIAIAPLACSSSPESKKTEVKVGGDKGVVVEKKDGKTEVKIGGEKEVVVK